MDSEVSTSLRIEVPQYVREVVEEVASAIGGPRRGGYEGLDERAGKDHRAPQVSLSR